MLHHFSASWVLRSQEPTITYNWRTWKHWFHLIFDLLTFTFVYASTTSDLLWHQCLEKSILFILGYSLLFTLFVPFGVSKSWNLLSAMLRDQKQWIIKIGLKLWYMYTMKYHLSRKMEIMISVMSLEAIMISKNEPGTERQIFYDYREILKYVLKLILKLISLTQRRRE